jgi:hypothetical protein
MPRLTHACTIDLSSRRRSRVDQEVVLKLFARAAALVALAGGAAVGPASPALGAPGFDLALTGPSASLVGQPVIVQATGANPPPAEYPYMVWLSVVLLRPSAVPTCPAGSGEANQLATGTGGAILTIAQREDVDAAGRFSVPVGFTPIVTGPLLVCAYSYNEVGATLALASLTVNVAAAAPAAPANVKAPRVTRLGNRLVCRAGSWSNDPSSYAYGWLVDGESGARDRTLRVTRRLRGRSVQCSVTASNAGGSATAVSRRLRIRRA